MVTKKDFEVIAEIVADSRAVIVNPQYQKFEQGINVCCQDIGNRLADYFATQNPHFDRQKFLNACGL